jgi:hypothetical protein
MSPTAMASQTVMIPGKASTARLTEQTNVFRHSGKSRKKGAIPAAEN